MSKVEHLARLGRRLWLTGRCISRHRSFRITERRTERPPIHWFTPQMSSMTGVELDKSLELHPVSQVGSRDLNTWTMFHCQVISRELDWNLKKLKHEPTLGYCIVGVSIAHYAAMPIPRMVGSFLILDSFKNL